MRLTREEYERAVMAMRGSAAAGAGRVTPEEAFFGGGVDEPYRMTQLTTTISPEQLPEVLPHYTAIVTEYNGYMVMGRYEPGRLYLQVHVSTALPEVSR